MGSAGVRRLLCVAATCALVVSVSARQNPAIASDAEFTALLRKAQTCFDDNDWTRGIADYEALVAAARAKDATLWEGRGILGLAKIANESARYPDARRHALDALAIFERLQSPRDIGDANQSLAIAAYSVNDDDTARTHYDRAAAAYRTAGDERSRIRVSFRSFSIGVVARGSLDGFDALQAEAHATGDKQLEGEILHGWGDDLFQLSLYEPAIEKLEQAVALFQEAQSAHDLATTYTSLGRLYRAHGQPAAALEYQLKGLKINETLNRPRLLIQSLNAVGVAAGANGDWALARTYYERALAEAERSGVAAYINFMRANLGSLLVETDADVERGRALLENAIAAGAGYATSARYATLTDAYVKLGRPQDALASAEKALSTCRTPLDCVHGRVADGRAQLAAGREDAALVDQKQVLAAVERMHSTLAPSDLLKQNFQRLWEQTYGIAIDLHFRRGEFREALEASELARSRAFLDLLATRELDRAAAATSVPAPTTAAATPPGDVPSGLTLRGAPAAPEPATPSASTLRSDAMAAPPTIEGLTAIAKRLHSTLLAYWVSPNRVYVWALAADGEVHGASIPIARSKLDALVRSIKPFTSPASARPAATTIATRGDDQIALSPRSHATWRTLYDLLIAPIERDLPRTNGARLTIVPDGPLLGVPFAALRDARGRYLIERYTIHSVPSAAVLQFTADKVNADAHAGPVLLIGDPTGLPRVPGEPPLPRLAGASEEVRAIARLLPASRATVLSGSAATEPRVRSALHGKAVVHFATHGIVRDASPLASYLALGAVGSGSADGQLTVEEIYGLDLDGSLVVLSACRSGGGVITGDGIAGLARAFFYAGAPSVIVSVWDVADQPTSQLLPAFYRSWLRGAAKADALRAAQLALMRSLRAGEVKVTLPVGTFVLPEDPAFWAAFVLLGEPD